ncbi:MAG: adenylate/guanylate cyclase domain-containing protein [Rhodospirillaceae bacterium]|jgi:adenylate cyclase|nr:adenylate/guanylate cyclase domain-containing protein [Rhodospirillaceae bacterium]MBT6117397.1 adenylate/guanylate cyclase domain-containing protein [Rhodospirillaceae bacterium]
MTDDALHRACLQSLTSGVAIVEPEDWRIRFENARFFQWFPPTEEDEDALAGRLPDLDADRARERLAKRGVYDFETQVRVGAREISLRIEIRRQDEGPDGPFLLVECVDASKQKEAEYMLDSYSRMVEKNTRELKREKERVEKLLLNIMPRSVYEEMKDFGTTTPQRFDEATVLMLDFVDFTEMAISRDPGALIAELNDIFSAFDRIVELFGCERIKTIGDAYLAVSGLPEANPDHAASIARVALRMRRYMEKRNASRPTQWLCRIGICTGPLIGSLVGIQKYVYDVFGPAVNLAARMESFAEPMQIALVAETQAHLRDHFHTREIGEFDIKGFGTQQVFALEGEIPRAS